MRLTVKGIEALAPTDKRREIPDSLMMGLYLIVQRGTGNKAWAVRCRQNGRPRKIGRYPVYGLAEAREAAAKVLCAASPRGAIQGALMPAASRLRLHSFWSGMPAASIARARCGNAPAP